MKIIVINLKKKVNKIYINDIICPECKNLARIDINDEKISINNCYKNHNFSNLTIDNLMNNQTINELEIKCNICNNMKYLYNDKFYCCSCNIYICSLCANDKSHKEHNKIEYNRRFYICNQHGKEFKLYCNICNSNLCTKCEEEHNKNHKMISFKELKLSNEKKINETINEIIENKEKIIKFKNEMNKINTLFSTILGKSSKNLDQYIIFYEKILSTTENLNNYQRFKNLMNMKNKKFITGLTSFFSDNIKNKIKYLTDIVENKKNEIIIIYNNNNYSKIKLFGKKFVENNKDNCFLIINDKIYDLLEYLNLDTKKKDKIIKIKLIEKKTITDMSFMFLNCIALSSLPDILNWNTSDINDMSCMFYNCQSLKKLPDISKWNTNKVINISNMFFNCYHISYLPDISIWNTTKIKDMSFLFYNCSSLKSLPNIKNFKMNNVSNISGIFGECSSLISIPDISNWFIKITPHNIKLREEEFLISKYSIDKNKYIDNYFYFRYIFYNCESLKYLPDISKWNTEYVNDMSYIFYGCSSLER